MADSDRQGSKPYKTYKAGRGKRRALDDELAGARPERPPKRIEFRIVHLDEPVPADMDLYESFTMPDGSELAFFIRK